MHPQLTWRDRLISRLDRDCVYDIVIVGGGASGLGLALDAAVRGFSVALVESHDFAGGTSSRSTKLVHGGVRYLAQGNIGLVRQALFERNHLLHNAAHVAQPLPFVVPAYRWWELPFYGSGLKLYDVLAGQSGLGKTEILLPAQAMNRLPTLRPQGLKGAIQYWDGQFDDARMALALARTAMLHGALLLNYCQAQELLYTQGKVAGLVCSDRQTGQRYPIRSRCVVNATGVWVDELRQLDAAATHNRADSQALVAPSQGVHLVVERDFLAGSAALMVPKTADGRVLFAVPWLGKLVLGTTDTARQDTPRQPQPFGQEVDFILRESANYLHRAPTRADVKSVWVGLRPLVKSKGTERGNTQGLSREHTVQVSGSGLVSVTGGKWTTYRAMAEDVLQVCAAQTLLPHCAASVTTCLKLVGAPDANTALPSLSQPAGLHSYGSEQAAVLRMPGAKKPLCEGLTEGMVRFAARHEFAIKAEDVLARRSRLLFLDARLAGTLAEQVGAILQQETGIDPEITSCIELAQHFGHLPV